MSHDAVHEADHALADLASSFDFLLAVTPTNTDAAWDEFCAGGKQRAPTFAYRPLAIDPDQVLRQLYDLPLDRIDDRALAELLRAKRTELARQVGMLEDRGTSRFLAGSLQVYGGVEAPLLAAAREILATPAVARAIAPVETIDAHRLAALAAVELDHYRAAYPALTSQVHIRDDIAALMVSRGDLLVPRRMTVGGHRADALLQHEIGTHVVTFANGSAQPLRVLAVGLAEYEAIQEGLALLAEFVAGGLDADRLRLIAARVIAVRCMQDGMPFPELVAELCTQHRVGARAAFGVATRVFRGGGLTKDAIYLRGLVDVLAYLGGGGALEPLFVGKLALTQLPLLAELRARHVLLDPPLRPRWLDAPGAAPRLARLRTGLTPPQLVTEGLA